jgi:hypothetical protein
MKSNNILDFIEQVIPRRGLVEGKDFEIISYWVYDFEEDEFRTIDSYYNMDTSLLFRKARAGLSFKKAIYEEIASRTGLPPTNLCQTPFPAHPASYFYKMKSPIDYDTAISLGFGVVRLLKPKKENEYLLYHFQFLGEDEDDEIILDEFHEELGLVKCYLQLTENGKFHDPKLEHFLEEYEDTLCYSIPCNPYEMVQRILMSLDKNKGELVVL